MSLEEKKDYQEKIQAIEVLVRALGTMVVIPEFTTNPETFVKVQSGAIQQPILSPKEGEDQGRKDALDKLSKLINSL